MIEVEFQVKIKVQLSPTGLVVDRSFINEGEPDEAMKPAITKAFRLASMVYTRDALHQMSSNLMVPEYIRQVNNATILGLNPQIESLGRVLETEIQQINHDKSKATESNA